MYVERDIALAIYITYTETKEIEEDDTPIPTPTYITFLDEEPTETAHRYRRRRP